MIDLVPQASPTRSGGRQSGLCRVSGANVASKNNGSRLDIDRRHRWVLQSKSAVDATAVAPPSSFSADLIRSWGLRCGGVRRAAYRCLSRSRQSSSRCCSLRFRGAIGRGAASGRLDGGIVGAQCSAVSASRGWFETGRRGKSRSRRLVVGWLVRKARQSVLG